MVAERTAIDTLDQLLIDLEAIDGELQRYEQDWDRAEQTHDLAEAEAALSTQANNAEKRKAEVVKAIEQEAWKLRVAKRQLKACQRRYSRKEREIDIQRTREANQRTIR